MRVQRELPLVVCGLLAATAVFAGSKPVAVSPGDASNFVLTESRCPTFSWDAVEGAVAHELIVYHVGQEGQEAEPIVKQEIPGSATSWTPPLGSCLARGGRHAWSVRAVTEGSGSEWSAPSLFQVAAGPSAAEVEQAIEAVRQIVAAGSSRGSDVFPQRASPAAPSAQPVGPLTGLAATGPAPFAPASGDSDLQVNGSSVVTVATLRGALCNAMEVRFLDQGDGTILDCKTGWIWLKDAGCLGSGPWDDTPPFDAGSVQAKVESLNNGIEFHCTDYSPGSKTDWQVPPMTALCGSWNGTCREDGCCASSDGMVNDDHPGGWAVANAADDANWEEEDAFVRVQPASWSATPDTDGKVWYVDLLLAEVDSQSKFGEVWVWPVRGGQ